MTQSAVPVVSVRAACCSLGGRRVLDDVNLDVQRGEVVVLIGPSGAGKTTLLRSLNHLETLERGEVLIGGESIAHGTGGRRIGKAELARRRREIGFVFQHFNLFPHMSASENVWNGPVRVLGQPKAKAAEDARALLERVGLADKAQARPSQLSGGQQQRVAIARALAAETPLFLLDEPFAALDALTRERLQEDVRQVSAETGRTTLFVTHSADEAAFLGSRIVVLTRRPGQIALDLPVDLPRTGVDPDELRRSPEYGQLRAEVGRAVKAASA